MKRDPYPLQWPEGWPRTRHPERSRFQVSSFARCRDQLVHEIELLGGRDIVLTSNLPLRRDGLPYAHGREPDDPGIAVYWRETRKRGSIERVMACDRWDRYRDNLRAIQLSIAALRGLDRWGTSSIVERAFDGFAALPPSGDDWRSVLGLSGAVSMEDIRRRYLELAEKVHPDHGGSSHEMQRLNAAYAAAKKEHRRD